MSRDLLLSMSMPSLLGNRSSPVMLTRSTATSLQGEGKGGGGGEEARGKVAGMQGGVRAVEQMESPESRGSQRHVAHCNAAAADQLHEHRPAVVGGLACAAFPAFGPEFDVH